MLTRGKAASRKGSEKLDAWADDLKVGLEHEIKKLDGRIKETRTKSKSAATLAGKLGAQKAQRKLEAQRGNTTRSDASCSCGRTKFRGDAIG